MNFSISATFFSCVFILSLCIVMLVVTRDDNMYFTFYSQLRINILPLQWGVCLGVVLESFLGLFTTNFLSTYSSDSVSSTFIPEGYFHRRWTSVLTVLFFQWNFKNVILLFLSTLWSPVSNVSNFSLVVFKIFVFVFSDQQFGYDVSWQGFLCVSLVRGLLSFLNCRCMFFAKFKKISAIYPSHIFAAPLSFAVLLGLGRHLTFCDCPRVPAAMVILPIPLPFSPHCSDWIISIDLPSSSLPLSSVFSILLLSQPSEFF